MVKRRSRRDLIQNSIIALLAVSAIGLFAQSQLYSLGLSAGSDYLSRLTGTPDVELGVLPHQHPNLVAPVRVAVTGTYGRYGNIALTTDDQEFEPLGTLLGEVLGSARVFLPSTERAFLDALSTGSSVYYDFTTSLPLSVLAGLMGVALPEDSLFARRLVVADSDSGQVSLYLGDEENGYLQCATAVSRESLQTTINSYEMGGASFAMDDALPDSGRLAPLSLFPEAVDPQSLPVLTATSALGSTDWLLSALNFNPRTNLRYVEADGTEVIVEGERSVRIGSGGHILYQSGGEQILTVSPLTNPTLQEAASGASQLLTTLTGADSGEASLYLSGAVQEEGRTILTFDYNVDGIPVCFSDSVPAAELTLVGSAVSELSLRFRQYTGTGQPSLLLPLPQAMAVAALQDHPELIIGYEDRGSETVSAQWLGM